MRRSVGSGVKHTTVFFDFEISPCKNYNRSGESAPVFQYRTRPVKSFISSWACSMQTQIGIILLTNFGNFDFGVFLAMTSLSVNTLLGMIADNTDFVAFDFFRFDLG